MNQPTPPSSTAEAAATLRCQAHELQDAGAALLVLHDMLELNLGKMPKFVRNFMSGAPGIREAMQAYVLAVKSGTFPDNTQHA